MYNLSFDHWVMPIYEINQLPNIFFYIVQLIFLRNSISYHMTFFFFEFNFEKSEKWFEPSLKLELQRFLFWRGFFFYRRFTFRGVGTKKYHIDSLFVSSHSSHYTKLIKELYKESGEKGGVEDRWIMWISLLNYRFNTVVSGTSANHQY